MRDFCLILLCLSLLCSVAVSWKPLFEGKKRESWVGRAGTVEGGETVVGMYCMREECIFHDTKACLNV